MFKFKTPTVRLAMWLAAVLVMFCLSSCVNQRMMMFEDDEWSQDDYAVDRMLFNNELEVDDYDH